MLPEYQYSNETIEFAKSQDAEIREKMTIKHYNKTYAGAYQLNLPTWKI